MGLQTCSGELKLKNAPSVTSKLFLSFPSRKSTGVSNTINYGSMLFRCACEL